MARTIGSPRPEPSTPLPEPPRLKRPKIRSASSAGTPGPSSCTVSRTCRCVGLPAAPESVAEGRVTTTVLPRRIVEPGGENFAAFAASWSHACVTRCGSSTATTSARLSTSHRWSPSVRALSRTSSVRRPTSVGTGRTKSGRSTVARTTRSSTSRCMRSTSSRTSSWVARTSWGSDASMSSRWPRTMVSGVRSSCPASSRSVRCAPKPASSRSSIALTVRARSEMSSSPRTWMRSDRSESVMRWAVSRSRRRGASSRPATTHPTTPRTASAASATRAYVRKVPSRATCSACRSNPTTSTPAEGSPRTPTGTAT